MYLKSIEIQGFKSFANRTVLEFHDGITGIVGPNGSGKSNVADAVRWVFGEQKVKQLRSIKMEDVIFAGTEKRKPLGFAYVSLTLDNSDHKLPVDYDEVSVSRRLFRSGESEYRLNGSICRLKDINEIFDDTGIGTEGYSIIGQGQIDKVLSGRPEERRELFDEAAGIVKFKRRKIITERKLESEHQNLLRVEDILGELGRQVKPLERQAENARKYLKLRDELRQNDINLFCIDMRALKEQEKQAAENRRIAEAELFDVTGELEQIRREYEELDELLEQLDGRIQAKQGALQSDVLKRENLVHQIRLMEEQIRSAQMNDAFVGKRITEIERAIADIRSQMEEAESEKTRTEADISDRTKREAEAASRLLILEDAVHDLREQLEENKLAVISVLNEKAEMAKNLQHYDTMLEQIRLRREQLSRQMAESDEEQDRKRLQIDELKKELDAVSGQISAEAQEIRIFEAKILEDNRNLQLLEQNRSREQMNYQQKKARLDSLENMAERYEGYGNSIQKVMELKTRRKGIIGVVADIIQTEKRYETAIETALGGSIQNIVTDSAGTAKGLIEYLKENRFGRATFIPLENLNNRTGFANEEVLREPGVIGLASELVQIKKEYGAVAKYLLGRIVVADNIDTGIFINRKYRQTLRIVTLDGELFSPGGSMTGGAFRNKSNLLGRRREIKELDEQIQASGKALAGIRGKEEEERRNRTLHTEELEKKKRIYQERLLYKNSIEVNLRQETAKQTDMERTRSGYEEESRTLLERMDSIERDNEQLQALLQENQGRNEDVEEQTRQLNERLTEKEREEEALREKRAQVQMELTSLNDRHSFCMDRLARLREEAEKSGQELEELKKTSGSADEEIAARKAQIEELNAAADAAGAVISSLREEIAALQKTKEEQTKEHRSFFEKRERISEHRSQLDREIFRIGAQQEKLEEQKEQQLNYMWAEYELTFSAAEPLFTETGESRSKLKKTIAGIKADIRALGDVNVNAIDSYKEVSERYEFLKGQHEDLVAAEKDLEKIVAELEQGMRRQFEEQFGQIQTEFDRVFKELFGGGNGRIELSDDDVLEAGITITAQPPGKKLQNMMQLSGGEKALTAIALLFAFQNLKPSPFCLLDEIEAALDGSNVVRFAEYLHKLTEHTQFIVITHRRGTMGCADRLYGITMQEKGVTTLVSVDLLESQLDK